MTFGRIANNGRFLVKERSNLGIRENVGAGTGIEGLLGLLGLSRENWSCAVEIEEQRQCEVSRTGVPVMMVGL